MSDEQLVERLRDCAKEWTDVEYGPDTDTDMILEAAEAIERLTLQKERLSKFVRDGIPRRQRMARKCRKAERELAEARAENERQHHTLDEARRLLRGIKDDGHGYRKQMFKILDEALAAPAPEPPPYPYQEPDNGSGATSSATEREAERRVVEAVMPLAHFVRHSLGAGPATNMPGREGELWREVHSSLDALAAQQQALESGDAE